MGTIIPPFNAQSLIKPTNGTITKAIGDWVDDIRNQGTLRPRNHKLGFTGDSRVQGMNNTGTSPASPADNHWGWWAQFFSRGAVRISLANTFGISGQTSLDIVGDPTIFNSDGTLTYPGRMGPILASDVGTMLWICLTNDIASATGAAATGNGLYTYGKIMPRIQSFRDQLNAIGTRVIMLADTPRGPINQFTGAQLQLFKRCIHAIRGLASPGCDIIDMHGMFGDPASANLNWKWHTDNVDSTTIPDNIHMLVGITQEIGRTIANLMSRWYVAPPRLPAYNAELYDAVTYPFGALNPNCMLLGTTGTLHTNVTGAAPDNTSCNINGSGLSAFFDKDANGVCRVTLTGTPTATLTNLQIGYTLDPTNISPNDHVYGGFDVEVLPGSTGLVSMSCYIDDGTTLGRQWGPLVGSTSNPPPFAPVKGVSGIAFTEDYVVPNPALSVFNFRLLLYCKNGLPVNTTALLHGAAVRKR